jgi:translation initiation factor 1 (eIF-1/SUI1)
MNPFENELDEIINKPKNIEIWVENMGKKKNTYITGLTFSSDVMKNHLRTLKKKHGCNGSLQIKEDTNQQMIHLQGNQLNNMIDYFTELGVSNIITKGI